MLGALVAVAVVAIASCIALLVVALAAHRRGSALALARDEADRADKSASEAEAARAAAVLAAETAEEAESEAEALAMSAIERAERAEEEAAAARGALERARAAAELDSQSGGLWVLEALRLERRWQRGVAPGAGPSPFDGSRDPAEVALNILMEAAREEVGASFDLTWGLAEPVPSSAALRLARLTEELLAEASIASDGGELEVGAGPGGMVVRLRTDPAFEVSRDLAAVLEAMGGMTTSPEGDIVVAVRWADPDPDGALDDLVEGDPEG